MSARLAGLTWALETSAAGSVVIGNDFSAGACAQGLVDLIVHLVAQEADVAIAIQEERAATVLAEELVDVAARVARAMALARMSQDHARPVLAHAGTTVRLKRV